MAWRPLDSLVRRLPAEGWLRAAGARGGHAVSLFFTIRFDRAVVCGDLDCNKLFEIDARRCPACNSEVFMPLATWLSERKAA